MRAAVSPEPGHKVDGSGFAADWETMVNQVVVDGWPGDVAEAGHGWTALLKNLGEVSTALKKHVVELKTNRVWSGAAYDAYAKHVTTLATDLDSVLENANANGGVGLALQSAAGYLAAAQESMPIPPTMVGDIIEARQAHTHVADGAFRQVFLDLAPRAFSLASKIPGVGDVENWVENNLNIHTAEARKIYNQVNTNTSPVADSIPTVSSTALPSAITDSTNPYQTGVSPTGGASGIGSGGGGSGGLPSPTGGGGFGAGHLPKGSGAGSFDGGKLGATDPFKPGDHLTGSTPPAGDGVGLKGVGSPPSGGGLAGAGGGGGGLGGASAGTGRGPLSTPGTSPFAGAGASSGIPGGGSTGREVTPTSAGLAGVGRGGTGSAGQADGRRKGSNLLSSGRAKGNGEKEDEQGSPTGWLYEDDDVWGGEGDAPRSVLGT
ncbi:hypothetical protein [Fodinicola feengrottensis]|uniref:PPE domain-containing protein n=1 Tax=Fodinicola feengrottensis TaxID=435914 RepID=A0ABN2I6E6_9ACTN|nr:hypothetical protein [Fodinicola feengrottensis]